MCSTFRNSIKRSPWPFTTKQCFKSSFSSTPAPFCDGSQDDPPALVTVEFHMCTDHPSSQTCSSGRNEGFPEVVSFLAAAGHTMGSRGALVHGRSDHPGQPAQWNCKNYLPPSHEALCTAGQDGSGAPWLELEPFLEMFHKGITRLM